MPEKKIEITLSMTEGAWGAVAGIVGGALSMGIVNDPEDADVKPEVVGFHDEIVRRFS